MIRSFIENNTGHERKHGASASRGKIRRALRENKSCRCWPMANIQQGIFHSAHRMCLYLKTHFSLNKMQVRDTRAVPPSRSNQK